VDRVGGKSPQRAAERPKPYSWLFLLASLVVIFVLFMLMFQTNEPNRQGFATTAQHEERWNAPSCTGIVAGQTAITAAENSVCCDGKVVALPDCSLEKNWQPITCGDRIIECDGNNRLVSHMVPKEAQK